MEKPLDRRKHVLIDEMQYRLLRVNAAYFVVIFATFMTSLFAPLVLRLLMDDRASVARERAAQQFLLIDETVWLPLLLTFLCLTTHSVFVSHRIAGPLVRLRRVLGAVGDGDLAVRATLRQKDYLVREQAVINEMIGKLSGRIGAVETTAEDIRARLAGLRTAIATGSRGEVLDQLTTLDERADWLGAALGQFTLRRDGAASEAPPRQEEAAARPLVRGKDTTAGAAMANARTRIDGLAPP